MIDFEKCPGCKAQFPVFDGPTHPYIGASEGCWKVYGEVLAKEYGEYQYPDIHRLTVDAYAVQHPGKPSRQSIQSVCVHLLALYMAFEKKMAARDITFAMRQILAKEPTFHWLEPPEDLGSITVQDVAKAKNLEEHTALVNEWAKSVWQAWSGHHALIRDIFTQAT